MCVFVIDVNRQPVMPCTGTRARKLLKRGRAHVHRRQPFTIMIHDRLKQDCCLQLLELKIDPGSKYSGICLSRTVGRTVHVERLIELHHRGGQISKALTTRATNRRSRRNRKTRYRQPRFNNRTRPKGWLAPSLRHRVDSIMSWVARLCRYAPISALAVERVKFDMQQMQQADIQGVEYQQGTLYQYEVREYLLERWQRSCMYCGVTDVPLEVEHIVPRSAGGSNRISNLGLACRCCNQAKGAMSIELYLAKRPALLTKIRSQLRKPLHDAAAVNATREYLFEQLLQTGLPVMTGTGSETKYNRTRFGIPKTHALDAACVGQVDQVLFRGRTFYQYQQRSRLNHLIVHCTGRGQYQRTKPDRYGFPRLHMTRTKRHFGFATGDIVRYNRNDISMRCSKVGRVAVRATGYFMLSSGIKGQLPLSVSHRHCHLLHMADGYRYQHDTYEYDLLPNGKWSTYTATTRQR